MGWQVLGFGGIEYEGEKVMTEKILRKMEQHKSHFYNRKVWKDCEITFEMSGRICPGWTRRPAQT